MSTKMTAKEHAYFVKLLALINEARDNGVILTIELEPRYPLSQGHFDMKPGVRTRDYRKEKSE
jgi:hypothetical protein